MCTVPTCVYGTKPCVQYRAVCRALRYVYSTNLCVRYQAGCRVQSWYIIITELRVEEDIIACCPAVRVHILVGTEYLPIVVRALPIGRDRGDNSFSLVAIRVLREKDMEERDRCCIHGLLQEINIKDFFFFFFYRVVGELQHVVMRETLLLVGTHTRVNVCLLPT